MGPVQITLLIEDLGRLATAVSAGLRCPAVERVWARGQRRTVDVPTANHLRFKLFGIDSPGALPIAALTHVSDRQRRPDDSYYWLRADPVTMWADMARVFMTRFGFADLDPFERNEIETCILGVLREEGIDLHADHPERWCIPLEKPLEFAFTPLDEALGMDVADALPEHPEARYWRRVLNEIQVALHNAPVNIRRRAAGRHEINSVWFWGGGFIPDTAPHSVLRTVCSDLPVSRGLAIIHDCRLVPQANVLEGDFVEDDFPVLIDWTVGTEDPDQEMLLLESLIGPLQARSDQGLLTIALYDGSAEGRVYSAHSRRRFWHRRKPLSRVLPAGTPE